jgi:hypothetical protein
VVLCWKLDLMAFLWLNVVGCVVVVALAWGIQKVAVGSGSRQWQ